MYKNIGAHKNLGVGKLLALTKHWLAHENLGAPKTLVHEKLGVRGTYASVEHWRPPMLAQEKVGGDAEKLPYS
jgi:hypothetical protein